MQDIGYEGYTGYELCHPLPKVNGEPVGIEFADKNAQLAAEYMRAIVKSVPSPAASVHGVMSLLASASW